MQIVVFQVNEEHYAVETAKVQNITDMMEITKVPKAPKHIKGLINLRGIINSLLDIHLLLGISKSEEQAQENIIILQTNEEFVGIAVDRVSEVLEIEPADIKTLDTEVRKPHIKGIINLGEKIITFIDVDKLIHEV